MEKRIVDTGMKMRTANHKECGRKRMWEGKKRAKNLREQTKTQEMIRNA